ncbi:MAG: fasciclin domain-containing protein [Flavobacteriaceae bacterium]|nr:MAG: fasciclin domain-containing protein [Flavobacteriaceae bacterium]
MKKTLLYLRIFFLSILVLPVVSCSDDDDDNNGDNGSTDPKNIVEIALETDQLTLLVQALQAADGNLVNVLQGDGPFTVLAPTNAAFTAFLASNGFGSIDDVPSDALAEILLNHVIADDIKSTDLASAGRGYASTSATGAGGNKISIYFNATAGVRFNNVSAVTDGGADVDASNGTIHIVDAVIPLPSVLTHAAANSDFSSLVTALGAADGDLIGDLAGEGPFTVLAPDNAAFGEFLGDTPLGNVNTADLRRILLNHVLDAELGAVSSTELGAIGNGYVNTSVTGAGDNPMSLYFNTTGGVEFNGISSVAQADVVGTNGIIHAVDAVIDLPTVVTFAAADPNFSTLVTALTDLTPGTDFVNILSRTEGSNADGINPDFTVFAPTNDAFAELDAIPGETTLTQILLHHVVGEANLDSSALNEGDNVASTLQGDNITVTVIGSPVLVTDGAGNEDIGIIATDVQAENGVIHVIDKVMLPNLQ